MYIKIVNKNLKGYPQVMLMFEYTLYNMQNKNDFTVSAGCLDVFENIRFLHQNNNIDIGTTYSRYCRPQRNAFLKIVYVHKNEINYVLNEKSYRVKQGEFIIFGRGSTLQHSAGPGGSIAYLINVNPQFCKKYGICDDIVCHIKSDNKMKALFLNFIQKFDETSYSAASEMAATQLFIHINHNYKRYSVCFDAHDTFTDNQMEKIIKYINRNIFKKIRLSDMAALFDLHPSYFSYLFKRTCGYSPVAYANFLRCENAKELLLTTDFSPKEVIEACGFHNMSHFKSMYKKITGRDALADAAMPPIIIKVNTN